MKLRSIYKKMTAVFLTTTLLFSFGITSAFAQTGSTLEEGKDYKVPVKYLNAKEPDKGSALSDYMGKNASFTYKNGKYTIELTVVKADQVAVTTYQTLESYSKYLETGIAEDLEKGKITAKSLTKDAEKNTATYEVSADSLETPLIISATMDVPLSGGNIYHGKHEVEVTFDTANITDAVTGQPINQPGTENPTNPAEPANPQPSEPANPGNTDGQPVDHVADLKDGTYSIQGAMVKTSRKDPSMTNDAIDHNIKLVVKDGKATVYLDFKGIKINSLFGYLGELSYYTKGFTYNQYGSPAGDTSLATVVSTQKDSDGKDVIDQYNSADALYPKLVSFPLETSFQYVPLKVFVPIMEAIAAGSGQQDVLLQLDWNTIKPATDTDFGGNENEELSPAVEQSDDTTGVNISADKGVLPEGTKFVAEQITEEETYQKAADSLADIGKKFKLYDFSLFANEQKVEPDGLVRVTLPVPDGYAKDKLKVYRIAEDGTKTLVSGDVEDNNYVFYVNHFSYYALVEEGSTVADAVVSGNVNAPAATSSTDASATSAPRTGDTNATMVFAFTGTMAMLVMAAFVYDSKRKKNA